MSLFISSLTTIPFTNFLFVTLSSILPLVPSFKIFLDNQSLYSVEPNDAEELVARAARNIEQLLLKRSAALEVGCSRKLLLWGWSSLE